MSASRLIVFALLFVFTGYRVFQFTDATKKYWEHMILQFDSNTTNENVINLIARPNRVAPGVYGMKGFVNISEPVTDDYTIEVLLYRSASGTSQYRLLPYKCPKTKIPEFMNTVYKKFFMESFKTCTNFPVYDGDENKPVPADVYYINDCLLESESWPTYMLPGYYKASAVISGPTVVVMFELTMKIQEV